MNDRDIEKGDDGMKHKGKMRRALKGLLLVFLCAVLLLGSAESALAITGSVNIRVKDRKLLDELKNGADVKLSLYRLAERTSSGSWNYANMPQSIINISGSIDKYEGNLRKINSPLDDQDKALPKKIDNLIKTDTSIKPCIEPQSFTSAGTLKFSNLPEGIYFYHMDQPVMIHGEELTVMSAIVPVPFTYDGNVLYGMETEAKVDWNRWIPVSITKEWDDDDDLEGYRLTAEQYKAMVHLYANGTEVTGVQPTVTDNGNNTYTVTYSNLPEKANGGIITYTVREDEIPEYTTKPENGEVPNGGTFTNTHKPGKTEINITKIWDDDGNRSGLRLTPDQYKAKIHLYSKVPSKAAWTEVTGKVPTVTDNGNNTYTVTYSDLQAKTGGETISYRVYEDVFKPYEIVGNEYAENNGKITNRYLPPDVTVVSIRKEWDDENNLDGLRLTAEQYRAKVHLYADGTEVTGVQPTVTDNGNNTYTVTYSNLPEKSNGVAIVYTVKEDQIPEYDTEPVSREVPDGGTFKNIHTPKKTSISITKIWSDSNNQDGIRPTASAFRARLHLYARVPSQDAWTEITGVTATVTDNGDNTYTVTYSNLPAMSNGEPVTYAINEESIDYYTATNNRRTVTDGGTITNSHTPTPPTPPSPPPYVPPYTPPYTPPVVPPFNPPPGEQLTEIDDYDTPLGINVIINHVGDCYE